MRVTQTMITQRFIQDIARQHRRMFELQAQAGSGVRLHRPSDDPVAVSRVLQYATELTSAERFRGNAHEAAEWLDASDAKLQEIQDVLARIRELVLRGANQTMDETARKAIIDELLVLKEHLLQIGNSAYKGRYLFAGTNTLVPALSETGGTVSFDGNDDAIVRQIGRGIDVQINVSGRRVFGFELAADEPGMLNVFELIDAIASQVEQNDADTLSSTSLRNLDRLFDDLLRTRSEVGARHNRAELAIAHLDEMSFQIQRLQSDLRDVDIAETMIHLASAETALRAALTSGARMMQPTLADFLNT